MTDLQELYQSVILDHNRKPRNFGALPEANREADGKNPLCGDEVHVALVLQDDTITDVRFTGHGCAISKASASLMTAAVKGKTRAEAEALFERFHTLVLGKDADAGKTGLLKIDTFAVILKTYGIRVQSFENFTSTKDTNKVDYIKFLKYYL